MRRLWYSVAALLWGLQFCFLGPTMALLLTDLFGASPEQFGTMMAVYNTAGLVFALLIPGLADRTLNYLLPMLVCAVLNVGFALGAMHVHGLWAATALLVLIAAPAGVGLTLLFAHMRHTGAEPADIMRVRAYVSFAWIAGQPLAMFVFEHHASQGVLWLIAGAAVLEVLVTLGLMAEHRTPRPDAPEPRSHDVAEVPVKKLAIVLMCLGFVATNAANNATVSVTSLLVSDHMHLPVKWSGMALGIAAGCEIPALLALGRLGRRHSNTVLVASGCVSAMAYYVLMASVSHPVPLLLIQPLKSWGFATMTGIGLTWFQQVIARPGLASGIFNNCAKVGAIVAGPMMMAGATSMGYAAVFWVALGVAAVSLVMIVLAGRVAPVAAPEPAAAA